MQNLVLIDDDEDQVTNLSRSLKETLATDECEIRTWIPSSDDAKAKDIFDEKIDSETVLVVTDYDLTQKGQTGLFGSTIVSWCQTLLVPVGNFSRGNRDTLPREPNQYEIRIPPTTDQAAPYIAAIYHGFCSISSALRQHSEVLRKKSPVGVLAQILGKPTEESRLALYGSGLGNSGAALIGKMVDNGARPEPSDDNKIRLLTYVLGHLLLNVVLRFPGPILGRCGLAAYLAIAPGELDKVEALFEEAKYSGPFKEVEPYFWLSLVDESLDQMGGSNPSESNAETQGELNREIVELKLGQKLARHDCSRCDGKNGGFLCAFTKRTVCDRPDCSVGSSGWIPPGARLCRIEKEFYDEWAPILGF